jgi:hypothetical protein
MKSLFCHGMIALTVAVAPRVLAAELFDSQRISTPSKIIVARLEIIGFPAKFF